MAGGARAAAIAYGAGGDPLNVATAGSGVTRNTHAHTAAGALAIPRAAADQDTVVTVTANVTGWTDGLTTDRDHLAARLQGDPNATADYTLDLDGVFDSVIQAGDIALDLAAVDIFPNTVVELDVRKNGARLDAVYQVLDRGITQALAFVSSSQADDDNSSSTNKSIAVPADVFAVLIGCSVGSPNEPAATYPAGWDIFDSTVSAGNFDPIVTMAERFTTVAENPSVDVAPNDGNRNCLAGVYFVNVDPADPFAATQPALLTDSNTAVTFNDITTDTDGALIVAVIGTQSGNDEDNPGEIAGFTQFVASTFNRGLFIYVADAPTATAGTVSIPSPTGGDLMANWTSKSFALKPVT